MKIFAVVKKVFEKIQKDTIFIYAAHASFYIIISAVPFAMVLLGILERILPLWSPDIFKTVFPPIPSPILPLIKSVTEELFSKRTRAILPVSVASLLFTSSRGITAAMRGVSRIYNGKQRGFFSMLLLSILYTILFLSVIIAIIFSTALTFLLSVRIITPYTSKVIAVFLVVFGFFLIYTLFCARKIPLKFHLPGALFTALSQWFFSSIYSFYIDNFSNYSAVYGSLTAVVLLFLWTYFSMVSFLFGAELNILLWDLSQKNTHNPYEL